jgi:hypothetical protein
VWLAARTAWTFSYQEVAHQKFLQNFIGAIIVILSTDMPYGEKAVREYIEKRDKPAALKSKRKSVPRHFKVCKQCGSRFLAKRANQEFHARKCFLRWNRANKTAEKPRKLLQTAQPLLGPA